MKLDKTVLNNPALFRAYMKQERAIPVVDLERCDFDKARKVLTMPSNYYGKPAQFYLLSHYTGKKVLFKPVQPGDVLFDEDQWDGEQQVYRPVDNLPNVDHMVIYNQF